MDGEGSNDDGSEDGPGMRPVDKGGREPVG